MDPKTVKSQASLTTQTTETTPKPKRKLILIGITAAILGLILILPLFISTFNHKPAPFMPDVPKPVKSWEVIFEYKAAEEVLSVKSISITSAAINRPEDSSPYRLTILDASKKKLYETSIHIAEQVMFNIEVPYSSSSSASFPTAPTSLDSLVTIPYFETAEIIQITKLDKLILEFIPPKQLSYHLIPEAAAQGSPSCHPLNVVFLSDGYTNMSSFDNDAEIVKAALLSTLPYSSATEKIVFKKVENPASNPLGCRTGNQMDYMCISRSISLNAITIAARQRYPDLPVGFTKYVTLVNGITAGTVKGAANGAGGDYSVFSNQPLDTKVAVHEIGGHSIGKLYDRYIYPASYANSNANSVQYRSNCTNNPSGEPFWNNLGFGGYVGCTSNFLYAPSPRDCGNAGSTTSIMSAVNCPATTFDTVEQYWIRTQILPQYSDAACLVPPSPSPSPSPTPSPSPSTSPLASSSPLASGSVVPSPSVSASPGASSSPVASNNSTGTTQPSPDSGGIPGGENVPPGYYTDEGEEASPIPFTCHQATTTNPAGKQIQLGYLICTPR